MSIIDTRKGCWSHLLAVAVMIVGPALVAPQPTIAAAQDYRFELAGPPAKSGKSTLVKLRLVHVADGKPVSGAIIIQTKFDMGPDGMASMTAPAKRSPTADAGVYQVETEPSMAGNWALTVAAKVQGETETVRGAVTVTVPK